MQRRVQRADGSSNFTCPSTAGDTGGASVLDQQVIALLSGRVVDKGRQRPITGG
jgi:hypothetical protein